jgi:hypothetical protein
VAYFKKLMAHPHGKTEENIRKVQNSDLAGKCSNTSDVLPQ